MGNFLLPRWVRRVVRFFQAGWSVFPIYCTQISRYCAHAGCNSYHLRSSRSIGSMVLPYMVTFIPSIYPSHVSKEIPALWIRHGIPQLQISWSDDRPKGAPVLPTCHGPGWSWSNSPFLTNLKNKWNKVWLVVAANPSEEYERVKVSWDDFP